MNKRKVILIIMDGWGHGQIPAASAIEQANTPFIDSLYDNYPNTELTTFGESVGLPEGQMGNSEVGHLNIGAGRVVYQELARINKAIKDGSLESNDELKKTFDYCKTNNKPLHLLGLVSDGGVHSHTEHLIALCKYAHEAGVAETFIHAFTDGRDTDPKSGLGYISYLQEEIEGLRCKIASVCGRYYAMDRDNRWERIKTAYDLLTTGKGEPTLDVEDAIEAAYEEGVTDEFIKPIVCTDINVQPLGTIKENDAVICFNFRTDRCREITKALTQQDFPEQDMKKMNLHYTTMTVYDHSFTNVNSLFTNEDLTLTLGEVIANEGLKQIRIAETEKYPHVTFFFSGGREKEFAGESRIMVPSPKVATYDLQPEMSAPEMTEKIVAEINNKSADFICLNFANADMVGHSGVFAAVVKACETVDACVNKVITAALENDYTILVTADHGNADFLVNEDGSPNTAHTMNPVPFFLIDKELKPALHEGILADIAPTILKLMEIAQPEIMTGKTLY
jgi:2,3-bisphosphoglycerate-independent phosphoglycerate mutase